MFLRYIFFAHQLRTNYFQGCKGFGVEVALYAEEGIRSAAKERDISIDEASVSLVMRRANRAANDLKGKNILWLDDNPSWNNHEVNLFRSLGLLVTRVDTEQDALVKLRTNNYDILLSDIKRHGIGDAGVIFLKEIYNDGIRIPAIFYISNLKPELGTPPYAFGITNRPDELLHLVIDIAERLGAHNK